MSRQASAILLPASVRCLEKAGLTSSKSDCMFPALHLHVHISGDPETTAFDLPWIGGIG